MGWGKIIEAFENAGREFIKTVSPYGWFGARTLPAHRRTDWSADTHNSSGYPHMPRESQHSVRVSADVHRGPTVTTLADYLWTTELRLVHSVCTA